jgi:hypothetical protein
MGTNMKQAGNYFYRIDYGIRSISSIFWDMLKTLKFTSFLFAANNALLPWQHSLLFLAL